MTVKEKILEEAIKRVAPNLTKKEIEKYINTQQAAHQVILRLTKEAISITESLVREDEKLKWMKRHNNEQVRKAEQFLELENTIKKDLKKKVEELIEWGDNERKNNNIFRKSADELNEDWIEKLEKLLKDSMKEAGK